MNGRVPYRLLDHTADVQVEILGRTFEELLTNAALCVSEVMFDRRRVQELQSVDVAIESPDRAELVMDWLRELLYTFSTRGFAVASVRFELVEEKRLRAELSGEPFDLARHGLRVELKVPTYHQFELEETPAGWRAQVIFDA
jgi:SHS2 domain-containing protein